MTATPPEPGNQPEKPPADTCWCVIAHANTPAEREQVNKAIDYARSIGDVGALPLLIIRLAGPCPARG